ncbi:hypothetical protein RSOLAG1IB_12505 [Rhizoctonia solani AG-1 IB]|uniref:CCHC-type domain-containing protein n=1 Tax=Thanatephorus cucumeris (strain AG1-IB / isolate 7/3/14) TaxID=1108050 RepID=M5C4G8_THACB|nr:hypothetical protein BN14_08023 [Rhizoctonia solani AG-1 IB]CEL62130.1 hypothetical protein RSOLAG1IB_12505 [Rhizoctonia solani AG-1 IB]
MVSTLQEGTNPNNPNHWYQALSTTWECLQAVCANEETFVAKQAMATSNTLLSCNCFVCNNAGHHAQDCPTLSPEERACCQEKAQKRKESQAAGNRPAGGTNDFAAQLAQLQA